MTNPADRDPVLMAARAICAEQCAMYGEPPCYDHGWPNPDCDEPGCIALATAACAALLSERHRAEEAMRERAARAAYEQRCERGTPWDLACTTIAAAIRALPLTPEPTHER